MKKRISLKLVFVLLLAIAGVSYLQSWPRSEAEQWLEQQSQDVASISVSYGSAWPGSIWKYVYITDKQSMQKLIASLRCKGNLTNTKMGKPDDALLGYNTSYFLTLTYKDSHRPSEQLVINPSGDRHGTLFLTRRNNKSSTNDIDIIGWAEMSSKQFQDFNNTLKSVPGDRRADRP